MSKQKKQHTGLHRVLLVLTSILLVVALAANVAGVYFAETIDNYVTGTHLDTSEKATAAVMETGEKVAEQIAAEGAVLLKNDGALPLASDVTKVNVFGWGSTQWLGSGSGSGRVVSTDTGLLDALEAAGIDYNSELTDMYKAFQPERPYASNQVGTLNSWPEQSCRLYDAGYQRHGLLHHNDAGKCESFLRYSNCGIQPLRGRKQRLPAGAV